MVGNGITLLSHKDITHPLESWRNPPRPWMVAATLELHILRCQQWARGSQAQEEQHFDAITDYPNTGMCVSIYHLPEPRALYSKMLRVFICFVAKFSDEDTSAGSGIEVNLSQNWLTKKKCALIWETGLRFWLFRTTTAQLDRYQPHILLKFVDFSILSLS